MAGPELLPRAADSVVLRRLSPADLPAFQAYRQDKELGRYQGWVATTDAEAGDYLRHMQSTELLRPGAWCQIGIADAESQVLVGDIGLFIASDGGHAEIGFTLSREAQGRGLATAAVRTAIALVFEHTRVERVLAMADARNLPSVRLLERVGMQRIETRDTEFRGEPCVEHVYAASRTSGAGERGPD